MGNASIEKENSTGIDFNEKLRSFEDMFLDTDIIPNSRYRLVENVEESKPGYCNGILNEYEVKTLRKVLAIVDPESNSEPLDLAINTETVNRINIENFERTTYKRLVFNIGNNQYIGMSAEDSQMEALLQPFMLTMMGVVERRVVGMRAKNRPLIEFKIV